MSSINADIRRRLAEVDASILGLQYTRASLIRQLNMPLTCRRCAILANLSREITSEIFLHCLGPFPYYPSHSPANPRHVPMLLLHVCRTWRSIALETPGLWTNFTLDFDRIPQARIDNLANFIDDSVARAGACPLSLHLRGRFGRPEPATVLQRLCPRIRVLQLCMPFDQYPQSQLDLPLLQDLTICFVDRHTAADPTPLPMFRAAPQLRQVYMYGPAVRLSLIPIPWNNITIFQGERLSSRECLHVLRSGPSLVKVDLDSPTLADDTPTVSHLGLQSLRLAAGDILCEFLTLPALQHLDVSTAESVESIHLLPFISRSSASLVTLSSPKVPFESLSAMIALTDLTLSEPSSEYLDEFVGLLDCSKHQDVLPQLQVLVLEMCPPYVNTTLVDALSSRCAAAQGGGARLRSFRQLWLYGTPADALQGYCQAEGFDIILKGLARKGLDIYIGLDSLNAWLFNHQALELEPSH
ncbi:hypothetical protein C8R45DRAFT_955781 [Mycena sanguinolenta]|nr:hypothetical protein C8R45DRAFT_955781 [Mycena sanguinolenta]